MTYSEFARLPSDMQYEVITGEVYGTPTPSPLHQYVALNRFVQRAYEPFRGFVPALKADRALSADIEKAAEVVHRGGLAELWRGE